MSQFDEKKAYAAQEEGIFVSGISSAQTVLTRGNSLMMEEKKSSSNL
jgi:hypothetical protein